MSRRDEWRKVLDTEIRRWSAKSFVDLQAELREIQAYELEFDGKEYQVEVQAIENTETYLHVMVSVDDGSLPAALFPMAESFIRDKPAD